MEEIVSQERNQRIQELNEVIGRADSFLKEACEYFQWDIKDLEKDAQENYMICPFDNGHIVPQRSIQRHLESCEWRALGYTKECKSLPESATSAESPSTIKFDIEFQHKVLQEAKQNNPLLDIGSDEKLIPQTSDRLTSDFTRDERKVMYEYVIAHTVAPDVGQDITDLNKKEKKEERSTSLLELLAQERNLKRRKTRYRGVHTNKKSHIEIMREVVEQQMEMFKEYLAETYGIPIPAEDTENSPKNNKDEKRSVSSSSVHKSRDRSRERSCDKSRELHGSRDRSKNHKENDSHRSHSRDNKEKSRDNYKHHSRDYDKNSHNSSQYKDRDYKNYSKDSSRRHDYRGKDENDYKSRNRYNDNGYSYQHSEKSKTDDGKDNTKYRDKSTSSRDRIRNHNDSDQSHGKSKNYDNQYGDLDDSRHRKRGRSSSVDKKRDPDSKDDYSSRKSHKMKKHKSEKSHHEKHKSSKHKHKRRSRSKS